MKYILVLAVAMATLATCTLAHRNNNRGRDPPGGIIACIQNRIQNNATLLSGLITALNNAGLSQYVINGNAVNFTNLNQNLFSVLPTLAPFITTNVVPTWPMIGAILNATQAVIQKLQTDVATINFFTGILLINNLSNYVTGSVGSFTINFQGIQNDSQAARILNRYLMDATRMSLFPYKWGPFGRF